MVTVVVASYLGEENVRRLREVDGGLRVLYREDLVPPPRWDGERSGPEGWGRSREGEEEFLSMLAEAEVLFDFPRGHARDLVDLAPRLRWVQSSVAGAGDVIRGTRLAKTDVVVTTAGGVFSGPLAEFVLAAMLHNAKGFGGLLRDNAAKRWRPGPTGTLQGKTVCVVGMGSIGGAVARRARPFGMRVVGVKRTVREDDPAREHADALYPTDGLLGALGEADYVVATLPHTPETEGLLDAGAIDAIKQGAYFVNVGRGKTVDEGALAGALREGRLSGAALDVFEEEPLPDGSPLWEMPNVIVSPHSTDNVPGLTNRLLTDLFRENLRRYLASEDLLNVLDKELLY